jgi:predicted nucleic acid-binding protein
MDFVVDANIIFSCLIKNSKSIEILLNKDLSVFAPEFLLEELYKYNNEISKKTYRSIEEFREIVADLQKIIILIPNEDIQAFLSQAEEICPDKKDVDYFALALKLRCPIWSNDKLLKQQDRIKIYSTEDLINSFDFGKNLF